MSDERDQDQKEERASRRALVVPTVLTIVGVVGCIAVYFVESDVNNRAAIGGLLSGGAALVGFIWLIAAFLQQGNELRLQRAELRLQRQELKLQRQALELQREELRKMGKYAGLQQIAQIFDQFEASLQNNPKSPVKAVSDILVALTNSMAAEWKTILEGQGDARIIEAWSRWSAVEGVALNFVSRVSGAIDLYCEAAGIAPIAPGLDPTERIVTAFNQIKDIPHITAHAAAANSVAQFLSHLEPGRDKVRLAGMDAAGRMAPGSFLTEGVEALRAKIRAREEALAARKARKE